MLKSLGLSYQNSQEDVFKRIRFQEGRKFLSTVFPCTNIIYNKYYYNRPLSALRTRPPPKKLLRQNPPSPSFTRPEVGNSLVSLSSLRPGVSAAARAPLPASAHNRPRPHAQPLVISALIILNRPLDTQKTFHRQRSSSQPSPHAQPLVISALIILNRPLDTLK